MSRLLAVGTLVLVGALVACNGGPDGSGHLTAPPLPTAAPTVAPTPTPQPSLVGIWHLGNTGVTHSDWIYGFGIEISSYDPKTGEVRGRPFYDVRDLTGLLRGTYRASDRHLDWQTFYFNNNRDSDNGSMTVDPSMRRMDGTVKFEILTFNAIFGYNSVILLKD